MFDNVTFVVLLQQMHRPVPTNESTNIFGKYLID